MPEIAARDDGRPVLNLVKGAAAGAVAVWAMDRLGWALWDREAPGARRVRGLACGLGLFVAVDEGVVPALGLASGPAAYPWQAHARGLVTHRALGVVTHATLGALDRALDGGPTRA